MYGSRTCVMPSIELNEVKSNCGDRPLVAENDEPGIGANDETGPEAQTHGEEQDDRHDVVAARHDIGERIAENEASKRDDQRRLESVDHHACIEGDGEQPSVVIERYARIRDAEQENVPDR